MQLFCTLQKLISWECKAKKREHAASQLPPILDRELQSIYSGETQRFANFDLVHIV